jgi:hypothetical protein
MLIAHHFDFGDMWLEWQTDVAALFVDFTSIKHAEQCSLISVYIGVFGFEAMCFMSLLRCMKMRLAYVRRESASFSLLG